MKPDVHYTVSKYRGGVTFLNQPRDDYDKIITVHKDQCALHFAHTVSLALQHLVRHARKCLLLGYASEWSREILTSRELPKQLTSQHPEIPLPRCANQAMDRG